MCYCPLLTVPLLVKTRVCFPLQVGNSDIDDVNIIAFRQINQFDLSGNVITASEYLSTLCVSSSLSSLSSVFVIAFTMNFFAGSLEVVQ